MGTKSPPDFFERSFVLKQRKFLVTVETPGLLISLKGKPVRTPVTIIATEDEIPLIRFQIKANSAGYRIEEIFDYMLDSSQTQVEKIEIKKENIPVKEEVKIDDVNFSDSIDIEELSIKYETLLDKMIKSTK